MKASLSWAVRQNIGIVTFPDRGLERQQSSGSQYGYAGSGALEEAHWEDIRREIEEQLEK